MLKKYIVGISLPLALNVEYELVLESNTGIQSCCTG
jgi:hypothetical protein